MSSGLRWSAACDVLGRHATGDESPEPGPVSGSQGLGGAIEMSPVGIDRAQDDVVLQDQGLAISAVDSPLVAPPLPTPVRQTTPPEATAVMESTMTGPTPVTDDGVGSWADVGDRTGVVAPRSRTRSGLAPW